MLTCHSIILKYIKNISNKLAINGKLGYKVSSPTLYSEIKIENDTLCIRCLKNDNHFYELEVNADAIRFYSVVDGVWTELWKK